MKTPILTLALLTSCNHQPLGTPSGDQSIAVNVQSFVAEPGSTAPATWAAFVYLPNFDSVAQGCVEEMAIGACRVLQCSAANVDAGSGSHSATPITAGSITISGGTEPAILAPNSEGLYPELVGAQTLWNGDTPLSFMAVGAQIPAFQEMLTAPAQLTVTEPPLTPPPVSVGGPSSVTIDRSLDLVISWTGSAIGTLDVRLSSGGSPLVRCLFPASDGTDTVPGTLLRTVPSGAGQFQVTYGSTTTAKIGDWQVEAAAYSMAISPSGFHALAHAMFK